MADVAVTIREDEQGYLEGVKVSQEIIMNIAENSHWFPGVTYKEHKVTDTGQILIPQIDIKNVGNVTDLCADADPAKAKGTPTKLIIDKTVSGVFNGCFPVAGIANPAWESAVNLGTKLVMVKQFENYLDGKMYAGAAKAPLTFEAFRATYTGEKPATAYLAYVSSLVKKATGRRPSFAFVNYDIELMLLEEIGTLTNNQAGTVLLQGEIANLLGMRIIATDLTAAVVVGTADAMNVGRPTKISQIPDMVSPLGEVPQFVSDVIDFDSGVVSKVEINAAGGLGVKTYLYLPIGVELVGALMYQGEMGSATPTP